MRAGLHALAPGAYRVRFTNAPLGASVERTIELAAGEARRLVIALERLERRLGDSRSARP